MSSPSPPRDNSLPRASWLPRPPRPSNTSQLTHALTALPRPTNTPPTGNGSHNAHPQHSRYRHGDEELCDTAETQELLDNFFALYAPPPSQVTRREATGASASGDFTARTRQGNDLFLLGADEGEENAEEVNRLDNGNIEVEDDEVNDIPLGRSGGHHAQQSQYEPPAEEDEEGDEIEDEDGGGGSPGPMGEGSWSGSPDEGPTVDLEGTEVAGKDVAGTSACTAAPSQRASVADNTATRKKDSAGGHYDIPETTPNAASAATLQSPDSLTEHIYWPFPHPPPLPPKNPHAHLSRAAYHTQRYGAFIKAYLALSDAEVRQAERRGRGICMIGVRKTSRSGKSGSSSSSFSCGFWFDGANVAHGSPGGASSDLHRYPQPSRGLRRHVPDPVRTQRVFLRHSVLAVEGDAVFCQLIDRAEVLYAVEQQRLDSAAAAAAAASGAMHNENTGREDAKAAAEDKEEKNVLHSPFRKLPRVAEPYLRPNARCIALHYGLPDTPADAAPKEKESVALFGEEVNTKAGERAEETTQATKNTASPSRFPRATLIAVVSTTRLDENAEIYVSLDSYCRCLDEVAWYRRCYGQLNRRYGCSDELGEGQTSQRTDNITSSGGAGDVYTGVKRFAAWPAGLTYYHGVGRRHASATAAGAFPFTLTDLGAAPELGPDQKGVAASLWIPYGTCFLYCGPSVATRKVEKLVSARVLHGATADGGEGAAPAEDRQIGVDDEEGDMSFATDDTYALGLGRHGVCFGQGLTRYINHRYNTSRFGNVELCSVMLSVPSEFREEPQSTPTSGGGSAHRPHDPSLADAEHQQMRNAARRLGGRNSGCGGGGVGTSSTSSSSSTHAAATVSAGKRRPPPQRRKPSIFLEEKSFFVTVPFFLVTTDIPPGTSLLAWTYGEDYDAKLEREAVADGHLVPYADAALLNRRLSVPAASSTPLSTRRTFQRYSGDYRFAVGVGDVVWRRRPLPHALVGGNKTFAARVEDALPFAEEDLFAVVQTQRGSVEQVLLQSLEPVDLADEELGALLCEQQLSHYVSPHATSAQAARARHGAAHGISANAHEDCRHHPWSTHWAVFQLPQSASTSLAASLPLTKAEDVLRRCAVATVESVALLLPDIDYSVVHTQHAGGRGGGRGRAGRKSGGSTSSGGRVAVEASRRIVVNLDDLHHATQLVRTSAERALRVPPLFNGLLWPLFSAQLERGSTPAATSAAANASGRARAA